MKCLHLRVQTEEEAWGGEGDSKEAAGAQKQGKEHGAPGGGGKDQAAGSGGKSSGAGGAGEEVREMASADEVLTQAHLALSSEIDLKLDLARPRDERQDPALQLHRSHNPLKPLRPAAPAVSRCLPSPPLSNTPALSTSTPLPHCPTIPPLPRCPSSSSRVNETRTRGRSAPARGALSVPPAPLASPRIPLWVCLL